MDSNSLCVGTRLASFLCLLSCVYAANILAVVPSLHSLCRKHAVLGCELSQRGHKVTFYISAAAEREILAKCLQDCDWPIRNITWMQEHLPPASELFWRIGLGSGGISFLDEKMAALTRDMCLPQIADIQSMSKLKMEKFDIALMPGNIPLPCFYVVPYLLDLPYISTSTFLLEFPRLRPWLPHMVPATLSQFSDSMNLLEKFQNIYITMRSYALIMYRLPITEINNYAPELSRYDVMGLIEKSTMFFENLDPIGGYPLPTWPNVVQIGGFVTRPAKPLQEELGNFIENSKNGIILLTFGSILKEIPETVLKKIQNSMHSLKYNFIVKAQYNKQDGNILYKTWLPQNDILGHNQTKLFISHCGNNGLYEAIYHGVPVLCLPVYYDQPYNAKRVESLRIGKRLNIRSFTTELLTTEILYMLENEEYNERAKALSSLFHDLPQHPREKAVDWIEYVIKHGGEHLRPRAQDMPIYRYLMLDMIGVVLITLCISIYLTVKISGFLVRIFFKQKTKLE